MLPDMFLWSPNHCTWWNGFRFFCDSKDFNVMSGSDWALLTSLKHYKCWDNTNWQTECSRFLCCCFFFFFFKAKTHFPSFPFFFFFAPFLVFMPFISMASRCTVGIAAALAPCVRQRERSVSTPSIPQSHTVMSERSSPSVDVFLITLPKSKTVPSKS